MAGAVHVVGAGVAGLAAALRLARGGHAVTLHEASPEAGGRCRALPDGTDNGTHALTGANTAALGFLREIGAADGWVEPEPGALPIFDLSDGTARRVALAPLGWRAAAARPAGFSVAALWALATGQGSVAAALRRHARFLRGFVEPLTVAALNTPVEEASAPLLRRVLARLLAPGAARVLVARQGLGPDMIVPALAALRRAGVPLRFGARLRGLEIEDGRVRALEIGAHRVALGPRDAVVLALPPWEAARLIPGLPVPPAHAPILNIHYARPGEGPVRFLGLLGGLAQWVLVRPSGVSVTVSAADAEIAEDAEALGARVWPEVRRAALGLGLAGEWPEAAPPFRVVKERRATPRHGVAPNPTPPRMPLANCALAGDWTWPWLPATIEASVLSGLAAAAALHGGVLAAATGRGHTMSPMRRGEMATAPVDEDSRAPANGGDRAAGVRHGTEASAAEDGAAPAKHTRSDATAFQRNAVPARVPGTPGIDGPKIPALLA
ncbi:MAG: FAD-dependent oxidoreductase [Pseudomonadota bacterium]